MEEFVILHQIPGQKNIAFSVQVFICDAHFSFALLSNSTDYMLSFCQIKQVVLIEWYREIQRLFNGDVFQAGIDELNEENVLSDFAKSDSDIRILTATIANEVGVYNQGVNVIIHYGPSRNIEAYHHNNGKLRWNTFDLCTVVILYYSFTIFMLKCCCDN